MNAYRCPACHRPPNFPNTGNQLLCLSCKRVFPIRLFGGRLLVRGEIPLEIGPARLERAQRPRLGQAVGAGLIVLVLLLVRRFGLH